MDVRSLRGKMLQHQTKLHPDRFGSQGEKVVSLARELSGRVNEAYSTLADPLKRAEYIVSEDLWIYFGFVHIWMSVETYHAR